MPRLRYNLDGIQSLFTPIAPGKYLARLTDCSEGDSAKGNPMLTWSWEIVGNGEAGGREIRSYTSLQDHALFGLKSHLEAFGLSGDVEIDTERLVGKTARLTIGNGKVKDRDSGEERVVSRVVAITSAGTAKAAPQAAAARGKKAAAAPAVAAPQEEDEEDDAGGGIPF